jgi:hypothetical protein
MGKASLFVDNFILAEMLHLPEGFEVIDPPKEGSRIGRGLEVIVQSDLIPECANPENLPYLMPVLYQRFSDMGERVVEMVKITVHGEFEPGKEETKVLFEKEPG